MNPATVGADMMKNPQFMELFQRALGDGKIPDEKDPNRDAWLKTMQEKLAAEATKEAKKQLETPVTDQDGQWMYIVPEKGFCIKCSFEGGLKGKVFINICQHERIAEPIPLDPEEQEESDAIKFKIPLSCGQPRTDTDKAGAPCKVYDVIVNPNTVKKCSEDAEFRRFVAALCMTWIKQKSEPRLNADEFKNVNFSCKGVPEAQRIRLSHTPKQANALGDEIKLPSSSPPAAPQTGKPLIEEVIPAPAEPTFSVEADGQYDWGRHARPTRNPHFRENVPKTLTVIANLPTVQTIKEVDVQISEKQVRLTYVDSETPFMVVPLPFSVAEEPVTSKFVRSKGTLKLCLEVLLADETDERGKTKPSRDAAEEEEEALRAGEEEREKLYREHMSRQKRLADAEQDVMNQRKEYVANMSAVMEGSMPPALRDEVDSMSPEQQRSMLMRLEGKVLKGDSVDEMLNKLPEDIILSICDHLRAKLGLEPAKKPAKKVTFAEESSAPVTNHTKTDKSTWEKQMEDQNSLGTVEYNFAKKAEHLFGVPMNNRYLFALDH
jgi:hypothetical protein